MIEVLFSTTSSPWSHICCNWVKMTFEIQRASMLHLKPNRRLKVTWLLNVTSPTSSCCCLHSGDKKIKIKMSCTLISAVTLSTNLSRLKHHTFLQTDSSVHSVCFSSTRVFLAVWLSLEVSASGCDSRSLEESKRHHCFPSPFQPKQTRSQISDQSHNYNNFMCWGWVWG